MRILIFGATGMLGHKLYQVLGPAFDTWGTVRGNAVDLQRYGFYDRSRIVAGVEASNLESVRQTLEFVAPDVVVNAIGAVKQVPAGEDPDLARSVNSAFPHGLADLMRKGGARLITISTDCVFSGKKGNYSESDIPDATHVYGVSKKLGEPVGENVLVLRTSFVGRELQSRHGIVEWFLSNRGGTVPGYVKAIFSGLTTLSLSHLIEVLIAQHPELSGLYHVSADPISKFDLLVALNQAFATEIDIAASYEVEIDRSLDSSLFRSATGWHPASWSEMVSEMAADPTPYGPWRGSQVL